MRAAVLTETGRIEIKDVPKPELTDPDWVLIKTEAVGICGSEVHAFKGTHPFRKPPVVLGHEPAGTVVEIGKNIHHIKAGDRVVIDPQWVCGTCSFCLSGDVNLCPDKKFLGTAEWPGAFGEYITVPGTSVFPLPDNLSFPEGAAIEALSVAVHIVERMQLQAKKSICILGSGAIGGFLSAAAKVSGTETVIIADINRHCLERGRQHLGADYDILLPDVDFPSVVKELTRGAGVDVVAVCADDPALLQTAFSVIKRRGNIAMVAFMPEYELTFGAYDLIRTELSIIGSFSATVSDFSRALDLAASGQIDPGGIITHVLPIEEAQRGFELASTKKDNAIKVVLSFS